jgi:endonuclease-8
VRRLSARPDRHIGAALLDQTNVAGIGTFYMAEALFVQRVSPWAAAGQVDLPAILDTARRQLLSSVAFAVPTTTGETARGRNSYVHARSGRPCRRCGRTVRVASVGEPPTDRTAFYCPTCQPGPTPTDDGRPQRPLGHAPPQPFSPRDTRPGYRRAGR